MLSSVTDLKRQSEQTVVNHLNAQPVFDIYANVQDRDLGSVKNDIQLIMADEQKKLPLPDTIVVRGQALQMHDAFLNIGIGLIISIVAVYLLMVLNYQSWGDPFVVLCAAAAGLLRHAGEPVHHADDPCRFRRCSAPSWRSASPPRTRSCSSPSPASIARRRDAMPSRRRSPPARPALRPVLMTALAMFVGPAADGDRHRRKGPSRTPRWPARVLGGVAVGTCSTLLFVPSPLHAVA